MHRVAIICLHSCPLSAPGYGESGGMNVYVRELGKELARRGTLVDIYTRKINAAFPDVSEFADGCRVIHVEAGPRVPVSKNRLWLYLEEFVAGVIGHWESDKVEYDIIHSHYWLSGLVALKLRSYCGLPVVHMFHTLGRMKNLAAIDVAGRESEKRIKGEIRVVNGSDALVASSDMEKVHLRELYGAKEGKIHVIPCGVDLNLFKPIANAAARRMAGLDGARIVLFVGRIDPVKGIDNLIRAAAFLKMKEPDLAGRLKLIVVGGPQSAGSPEKESESRRLKKFAARLGIESSIIFAGPMEQHLLPAYYSAADVTVLPSRYDSFGMVALEAMACGSPVIATDAGGISPIVKNGLTGYVVAGKDWRAMADRISQLVQDEELKRKLGAAGVSVARNYSWSLIADKVEQIYASVVGRQNSGPIKKLKNSGISL